MVLLAEIEPALQIGGALAGLFAFVLTLVKGLSQDSGWRHLLEAQSAELADCRAARAIERAEAMVERTERDTKIRTLEGEMIALRRFVHEDVWLGTDAAATRERMFDQDQDEGDRS